MSELENIEVVFKASLIDAMRDSHDMWKPLFHFDQLLDIINNLRERNQELEDKVNGVKEVEVIEEES